MEKINNKLRQIYIVSIITIILIVIAVISTTLITGIKEIPIIGTVVMYGVILLGGIVAIINVTHIGKKEKLESTRKLQLIYRPDLKLGKTMNINNLCKRIKIFTSDDRYRDNNSRYGHYFLEIRNNGKGEMAEVKLKDLKVKCEDKVVRTIGYFSNEDIIDFIEVNDSIVLSIGTPENLYNNDILTTYDISFVIEYRGILNSKMLKDKISFTVSNNNKNNNNIYNFKVENII